MRHLSSTNLLKHLFFVIVLCLMLTATVAIIDRVESKYTSSMVPAQQRHHDQTLIPQVLFNGKSIRKALIGLITDLRPGDTILIAAFIITDTHIISALIDAHRRGVTLRIVADYESAQQQSAGLQKMVKAGIKVHMLKTTPLQIGQRPGIMHNKFIITETCSGTPVVVTGSYNFTHSAAEKNYENCIFIYDADVISAFKKEFLRLVARCHHNA